MPDGLEDASDTLGYTPARGVARSLGELFHDPQDSRCQARVRVKAKNHTENPYFQRLGEMLDACADSQPKGCGECPSRRRCNRWWTGIANQTGARHLIITAAMYKKYRAEFEGKIRPQQKL